MNHARIQRSRIFIRRQRGEISILLAPLIKATHLVDWLRGDQHAHLRGVERLQNCLQIIQQVERALRFAGLGVRHEIDILEPHDLAIAKQGQRLHCAGEAIDRTIDLSHIARTPIHHFFGQIIRDVFGVLRKPLLTSLGNEIIVVAADECKGFRWHGWHGLAAIT